MMACDEKKVFRQEATKQLGGEKRIINYYPPRGEDTSGIHVLSIPA
jgi:hypothetical protein